MSVLTSPGGNTSNSALEGLQMSEVSCCLHTSDMTRVFGEELHHRGEIIAILWQIDIQPHDMGWLSVLKKTNLPWRMT